MAIPESVVAALAAPSVELPRDPDEEDEREDDDDPLAFLDEEDAARDRLPAEVREFVRSLRAPAGTTARDATRMRAPADATPNANPLAVLGTLAGMLAERDRQLRETLEREGAASGPGVLGLLMPGPGGAATGARGASAARSLVPRDPSEVSRAGNALRRLHNAVNRIAFGNLGGAGQGSSRRMLMGRIDDEVLAAIRTHRNDEVREKIREIPGTDLVREAGRRALETLRMMP